MSLSVAKVTEKHLQIIVSIWCKISRKKHLQINGKPHSQGHPFCIYIGGSGFDVALTKGGWGCISTPFGMEFEAFLNFTACVISQVVANMYDMLILMTAM